MKGMGVLLTKFILRFRIIYTETERPTSLLVFNEIDMRNFNHLGQKITAEVEKNVNCSSKSGSSLADYDLRLKKEQNSKTKRDGEGENTVGDSLAPFWEALKTNFQAVETMTLRGLLRHTNGFQRSQSSFRYILPNVQIRNVVLVNKVLLKRR